MRGLTIIVATADPARLRAALEVAAAQAALGRPARLFLQSAAVGLLRWDEQEAAPGQPSLRQMFDEAVALGAGIAVCQSGLALAGMSAAELPQGVETGGLVEMLASRGDDELLMV